MQVLQLYFQRVQAALQAVQAGQSPSEAALLLQPLQSELLTIFTALAAPYLKAAEAGGKWQTLAAEQRANEMFTLSYRGGGSEQVVGWPALVKRLNLAEGTLRVYFSKGKGAFQLKRINPLIGDMDELTVMRENFISAALLSTPPGPMVPQPPSASKLHNVTEPTYEP